MSPTAPPTDRPARTLTDGRRVWFRRVESGDEAALEALLSRLGVESSTRRMLTEAASLRRPRRGGYARDDESVEHGLIAVDEHDHVLGHAGWLADRPPAAQVFVGVEPDVALLGLDTLLLVDLAQRAERLGIESFTLEVRRANREIATTYRTAFDGADRTRGDAREVVLPTKAWRLASVRSGR